MAPRLILASQCENEVPVTRRQRWWSLSRFGLGNLKRRELTWLFVGLTACVLLLVFLKLASEVIEGDTQAFDTKILQALRDPHDPSKPIGPPWIEGSLLDLTALGGPTVLTLVVLAVVGFLLLQTRYRTALFVVATWLSGELVNSGLKHAFNRPRPTIVPHLREVFSTSFPSGHAMESAIVYLTLGAILMRVAEDRLTKVYCLGIAVLLTVVVGTSRVYLGVHYPTDVIGGWIIGFAWASICWLVEERFEAIAGIAAEKTRKP
jgi:undecaprenyl-diphosphatase